MAHPRVSSVIPVLNQTPYAPVCLAAPARDDEIHVSAEVFLVDRGSTDDTPAVLVRAKLTNSPLDVFQLYRDIGLTPRGNFVGEWARGARLVIRNNDTIPNPGWLGVPDVGRQIYRHCGSTSVRRLVADRFSAAEEQNGGETIIARCG